MVIYCTVCTNNYRSNKNVSYFNYPKDSARRNEWLKVVGREDLIQRCADVKTRQQYRICEHHFENKYIKFSKNRTVKYLYDNALPTLNLPGRDQSSLSTLEEKEMDYCVVSEQEAQPGPSKALDTRTSLDSNASKEQDPLSRVIEQCRFCGEFSKDCVAVSDNMPYLTSNKTTLVLNDTSVQLDFNNHSLPRTVCKDCDAKLQEIADFVKVVKTAQDTLINVSEERPEFAETRVEFEVIKAEETVDTETETLVIKTEYDSQQESDDDKEDKEGIVDSLTIGETVFVKKVVTHKRKSDTATTKPKKLKSKKCEDNELMIDIKEEMIEKEDRQGQSEVSADVNPSELGLATSALVFKMAGGGTSDYQGCRSDR